MGNYKVLNKQRYTTGRFSLLPIRFEDRWDIMKWRNEQIYHLRQSKPLIPEDQDRYFNDVVSKLFEQEQPAQLLFSFLEGETCIGYGGLVHINWIDQNAEISFIMNTELEEIHFETNWLEYLNLIEEVAFSNIGLHKIFVYMFDLRPKLYDILTTAGYYKDAILKEHCLFDTKFIDVYIYSKIHTR